MFSLKTFALVVAAAAIGVQAERHVVHFDNRCGRGTPTLIQGSNVLSTGADYVSNGPLRSAIAYLQVGNCGFNGDGCTMIETTLVNPTSPGSGSSTDITLIPPWVSFLLLISGTLLTMIPDLATSSRSHLASATTMDATELEPTATIPTAPPRSSKTRTPTSRFTARPTM